MAASISPVRLGFDKLIRLSRELQVSRRGTYSVERLLAFDDYCKTRSFCQVLFVCTTFPLLPVLLLLSIEAIPLERPDLGWRLNRGYWIRVLFSVVLVFASMVIMADRIFLELQLSRSQRIAICLIATATHCGLMVATAALWRFPVPFHIVVLALPCCMIFILSFVCIAGPSRIWRIPGLRARATAFCTFIVVFGALTVSYSMYNAVFVGIRGHTLTQTALVLMLPVLRVGFRNVVARGCTYWEDLVPETTIFTVEVFNALYTVRSIQSANPRIAVILILVLDFVSHVGRLRGLNSQRREVEILARRLVEVDDQLMHSLDLLRTITQLVQYPQGIDPTRVRPLANSPRLNLGSVQHSFRQTAPRISILVNPSPTSRHLERHSRASNVILPTPRVQLTVDEKTRFVHLSMAFFFRCEYVVLVQYVELIVPVMWAVHLIVLRQLPNIQYYREEAAISAPRVSLLVLNITQFAFFELVSLLLLQWTVKTRLGFSPLHQLAFVLETQFTLAQSKLTMLTVVIPQLSLTHVGAFDLDWFLVF